MTIDNDTQIKSRRRFLKKLAYGSALTLAGCTVDTASVRDSGRGFAAQSPKNNFNEFEHKMLAFEHTHTGETLKLTYYERGHYIKGALHEIDYLLRDFRTDEIHPIDTSLLDQLFDLKQALGIHKPFHIISAYRSPLTNAQLRKHGHGVAERSYHIQGRAIDIRVEGIPSSTIRNAALKKTQGGVGYYPKSNFVHLDTGRFRTWS
jgi:uncharacterized protein YcbK (DUF882 family)